MIDGEYSYVNSRLLNIGATSKRHLQGVGRSQALFADHAIAAAQGPGARYIHLVAPNGRQIPMVGRISTRPRRA